MASSPYPSRVVILAALLVIGGLVSAVPGTHAQTYGVWGDPTPLPQGEKTVGGNLLLGNLVGIMGQARFGVMPDGDIGVQLGIPDFDFDFTLAGDWRQSVARASDTMPVDITVNIALGWLRAFGSNGIDFDFGAVFSKELATAGGQAFTPYGGLMIAIGYVSGAGTIGGADYDVHFRGGVQVPVQNTLGVNAEFQFSSRSNSAYLTLGATYGF